jgi:site-specific DNA recombinase
MNLPAKRCAIYTRKSTDNGLDKDFNTLDAQREACLSYIQSQKGEGWSALQDHYDDGGFTGSNMDRPALQKLLEDIKAGAINIVVVYKIDRLTRSLMDFSKLVEVFDQYNVTFISITQSFNTTTSMGRLTLNVLLSFAQFEREVISERVRDKIAASKKKGMWMGGKIPVGYKVVNKQLVPKEEEVPFVNMIFERYLALGSIQNLIYELKEKSIASRFWTSKKGNIYGGNFHARSALYKILNNHTYIGEVFYKGQIYGGKHVGIIERELWDKVQQKLKNNSFEAKPLHRQKGFLVGILYDFEGTRYTPTFTNKNGKRYRYYVSQNLLQYKNHPKALIARLPADEIDDLVVKAVADEMKDKEKLAQLLKLEQIHDHHMLQFISDNILKLDMRVMIRTACQKIVISPETVCIRLQKKEVLRIFQDAFDVVLPTDDEGLTHEINLPYRVIRHKLGEIVIHTPNSKIPNDDVFDRPDHEIQNWVKGTLWRDMYFSGKSLKEVAATEKVDSRHVKRLIEYSLEVV